MSRLALRDLPGILDCGLWSALADRAAAPTAALLTDIGNDIMYDAEPRQIAVWVNRCLDRLAPLAARTSLTLLPIAAMWRLPPARFLVLRSLFFPKCALSFTQIAERALELNERLKAIGAARGVPCVEQPADWYGFDPIHIRRSRNKIAWQEILSPWDRAAVEPALARGSRLGQLAALTARPEWRRVCGFEQRARQPHRQLRDGSTLWIY